LSDNRKVGVIGIWHLGAVYSACLADLGYTVTGMDGDVRRVEKLNRGVPPLFEPGLAELMSKNIDAGRLRYTHEYAQAVKDAAWVLVTIDTPVDDNDCVDLSPVFEAVAGISPHLEDDTLVIISSQVPVGTGDCIRQVIRENNPDVRFDIACSPENLRLGKAIDYFKNPDRIIIGADSEAALDKAGALFSVISAPKLSMGLRSAEMAKHALNCFLATSISFSSEIASLCEELGADALKVSEALQSDVRIGTGVPLKPGLGFSGGTLARDLQVLKALGEKSSCPTNIISSVLEVNRRQMNLVTHKLTRMYGTLSGLKVGILGLTYKVGTDTLRRSPALQIIRDLTGHGAAVKAHDPKANPKEVGLHKEFEFCKDSYEVAMDSDALVMITEWPEFQELDFRRIKSLMNRPLIVDTKNMLDMEDIRRQGLQYLGVGREQK
jgi:UDPglucose 6-dehydrogenase